MWNEKKLNDLLTSPSERLISDMKKIEGDIIFLGAGGKMGPTLCLLAKKAIEKAGSNSRVIAVSRFTDKFSVNLLKENGVDIISAELLESGALEKLPDAPNIIYMAGRKFGTNGQEYLTWAMNAWLPSRVAERYKNSRIVVFSSGNLYPQMSAVSGGAIEETTPEPMGEYAMSCLARERVFEYAARTFGTKITMYRLNYAVDLRYGVLFDIAEKVYAGIPISLRMPVFNCIWQGDANEVAIRSLLYAEPEIFYVNVTGPETVSVSLTARKFGKLLNKEALFCDGEELSQTALFSNSGKMTKLFGYPSVSLETMIDWQAEWIMSGGRSLGKPTHFEEKKGDY
ncbi:MAG: NAD-dependent epimerase/dehydratase family protein [Oscillospiraceae bacterium]|nr:NAD-dependent epimerase/dehydratase family protein [Oscillospiraceae bacterium]